MTRNVSSPLAASQLHRSPLHAPVVLASLLVWLLASCGTKNPAATSGTDSAVAVVDTSSSADADGATEDAGSTSGQDVPDTDQDVHGTQADSALADTGGADGAAPDAGGIDVVADALPAEEPGVLTVQNQLLDKPFNQVTIQAVGVPPAYPASGKVRIYASAGGVVGALLGQATVAQGKVQTDLTVKLSAPLVGEQELFADLVQTDGKALMGSGGVPATATFHVTGDLVDPVLVLSSQELPDSDLATLTVDFVRVPDRFAVGVWLAVYADDAGKIGALLGKQQYKPGDFKTSKLVLTSALAKGQTLHAVLREGAAGTGSWKLGSPVITDLAGQVVESEFSVNSAAFHAILEIEDQTLTDPKKLLVKQVTIPEQYFGGWLAIYDDDAGKAGALLGKLYTVTGTKLNQTLALTVAQQGDKTLHAVLYAGQKWDEANNVVMPAPGGGGMTLDFQVGAQNLSYIKAPDYTTDSPRHVMVKRAYSFDKPAWVVLARDDNGKPGTVLARKKVVKKFAGDVHLWNLTGDFLENGTIPEFLTGKPGTFRRAARGVDKLHVLLYADDPADNKFTYTEGGTEDQPVLDALGKPVTALMTVTVKASVQNVQKDSNRYYFPCPLSQHIANATKLPVDCRCHVNIDGLDFPECKADIADGLSMHFGEGPRARTHNFGGFLSGFAQADGTELIALMVWKDAKTIWPENDLSIDVGAVMGIDMTTRKRRVISGRYVDEAGAIIDVGTGPVLADPFEVQKGPDGKFYVASHSYVRIAATLFPGVDILRVDPVSGNREFVWRSNHLGYNLGGKDNPYGHCSNGRDAKYGYASVQLGYHAFGVGDKGQFFLSYAHNGNTPTSDGIGIIAVSADGKSCDFVTRTKVGAENLLYKGKAIGSGFEPQAGPYKGMLVKDGKLYASTELNGELVEVDIASGDRKLLHKPGVTDNNSGSSGSHVLWDALHGLIWQGGLSGATLLFDPAKGTSEPLWCAQNDRDYLGIACLKNAAWGNNGMPLERGMWMHPTDKELMFVVNATMIMRVHLTSGTSEIFSY